MKKNYFLASLLVSVCLLEMSPGHAMDELGAVGGLMIGHVTQ